MHQYIMGLVGAAAIIGIAENLLPSGAKSTPYIKLIAGLCLLCLAIGPVSMALDSLPELVTGRVEELAEGGEDVARGEYESILNGQLEAAVREQLCTAIERQLVEKFRVTSCEVGVELRADTEGMEPVRVMITLMGRDIFRDPYVIEAYIGDLLECECVVVIG